MDRARQIIAGLHGAFLGLALVKFGNPVILDHLIQTPENGWELVFSTWPNRWVFDFFLGSHAFLGFAFTLAAVFTFRSTFFQSFRQLARQNSVLMAVACLFGWYGWQWIASFDTVSRPLTTAVLSQFTLCLYCFLVGHFCLSKTVWPGLFWVGLIAGLLVVLWAALDQHFGGLEATRRMIYEQADLDRVPEEFLERIAKGRVFGTLFYPNALAGAILMLGPIAMRQVYRATVQYGNVAWGLAVGLLGYCAATCLYWSGSKSGWLIAAAMVLAIGLRLPLAKRQKWLVAGVIGVLALGAFGVRFAGYFQQGATSMTARFDYWRAALQIAAENPLTGSGPGTFQERYAVLKTPGAEMARLAHNDYLQQASDSGLPGFLLYTSLWLGSVVLLYRKAEAGGDRFAIWLGLAAWVAHSCVEFGLYIPALAWPAFTLLGWQLGNEMDTQLARN